MDGDPGLPGKLQKSQKRAGKYRYSVNLQELLTVRDPHAASDAGGRDDQIQVPVELVKRDRYLRDLHESASL